MSDWQKVRVTFTDAEGKEVSAVMWRYGVEERLWQSSNTAESDFVLLPQGDFRIQPIPELPTGLGAAIRAETPEGGDKHFVRVPEAQPGDRMLWVDGDGDYFTSDEVLQFNFTVLSEGIEL